jgi:hypothetical protein
MRKRRDSRRRSLEGEDKNRRDERRERVALRRIATEAAAGFMRRMRRRRRPAEIAAMLMPRDSRLDAPAALAVDVSRRAPGEGRSLRREQEGDEARHERSHLRTPFSLR